MSNAKILIILLSFLHSLVSANTNSCEKYENIKYKCQQCILNNTCDQQAKLDCPNINIFKDQCELSITRINNVENTQENDNNYNNQDNIIPSKSINKKFQSKSNSQLNNNLGNTYSKDISKNTGVQSGVPGKPTFPKTQKQKAPQAADIILNSWY